MPTALVTCGPAYEPIDGVRRLTNHSTGELGALLCQALLDAGFRTLCFRGEMAIHPAPAGAEVRTFSTNTSLADQLETLPTPPDVVFHAAALGDFAVARVEGADAGRKISSASGQVTVTLVPVAKLLPRLRTLFPAARIVAWKYELDGDRGDVLARARNQISHAGTDGCVVNGAAYGSGLGFLEAGSDTIHHFPDKSALCRHLAAWALDHVAPCPAPLNPR